MQDDFAAYQKRRRHLWFSFEDNDQFPEWACCYVVYLGVNVVYVGQTENLLHRMRAHRAKKSPWVDCGFTIKAKLSRRFGDWAMTEIRLIRRLRPELNRRGVVSRPEVCM